MLAEGPVEVILDDGSVARSDRFVVAVCTCRRSRSYPWCDTSHRPRVAAPAAPPRPDEPDEPSDAPPRDRSTR
ncbi:CDGSH iron-sulfur domain-containing protein [Streptomyces sp. H27-H1]|nr:CDGSH iron-sulfur domain-containing protein [Streptomyces sp. H27-H1]MCY0928926.1 CDGSH iron-sulfur domain-containing protein [Streptomyces sp. H27-H1]